MDSLTTTKLNRQFDRIRRRRWRQKLMFARIQFNRVWQTVDIVRHTPQVLRHITRIILKVWMQKKSQLRSLELAMTYRCNASCRQCSCRLELDKERERHDRLTLSEYKNAIDQAIDMGAFQFCLNGGEPLLEKDMVCDLTSYIHQQGGYVHLCSNGYALNTELLQELKARGLNSVELGLDGPDAATHDGNRLKGSFERVLKVIHEAHRLKMLVILNTVLTNELVKSEEMYQILGLAKKQRVMLQITPACLTGAYKGRLDLMLTAETKLFFYYLLSLSPRCRSDLYSSLTRIKCPAAVEKIGLQPYGDVVSCPLIQIKYGNIRQHSLKDIRAEMLKSPWYGRSSLDGCLPAMDEDFIRECLTT